MFNDNDGNVDQINVNWEDPITKNNENMQENNQNNLNDIEDNKKNEKKNQTKNFLTFGYWQTLFDINENDMKQRLLSMKNPNSFELSNILVEKLDYYGPFWISTTLIFVVFAFGNLSGYFKKQDYKYDFIASATSLIWGYCLVVPLIQYFLTKFNQGSINIWKLIAIYGYSLLYLIPFSILCLFPINWLQWILMICGGTLSGLFLKQNSKNILKESNQKNIILLSVSSLILQISLGIFIKLNFYYH